MAQFITIPCSLSAKEAAQRLEPVLGKLGGAWRALKLEGLAAEAEAVAGVAQRLVDRLTGEIDRERARRAAQIGRRQDRREVASLRRTCL